MEENNEKETKTVVETEAPAEAQEEAKADHKAKVGWIVFFAVVVVLIAISITVIELV